MSLVDPFVPKPYQSVECRCGWKGTIADCKEVYVCTGGDSWRRKAGREGYEYKCPTCKQVVERYYYRVS